MPIDEIEKGYRTQQYRPVWEVEAWAKGWLEHSKENPLKAHCNCNYSYFLITKLY